MGEAETDGEALLRRKVRAELRKRMRGLRSASTAAACAARSARIVERLLAIEAMKSAERVALFWPIDDSHEVDLRPLDATLRARGVTVAYPAIDEAAMTFRVTSAPELLEERGRGFREPPVDAPDAGDVDVIVVPALALDPRGHRLGYGAGYYDRTLPNHPRAVTLGVAFDYALLIEIPEIATDVAVKWVVTDARTIEIAADSE